eukprot:scaffold179313_cov33-Tisochrysis_lutea.AAC.1
MPPLEAEGHGKGTAKGVGRCALHLCLREHVRCCLVVRAAGYAIYVVPVTLYGAAGSCKGHPAKWGNRGLNKPPQLASHGLAGMRDRGVQLAPQNLDTSQQT